MVEQIAKEALAIVVNDSPVPHEVAAKYAGMTKRVKAHILSYLGDDIEAAKAEFAKELLANSREVAQHIMGNYKDFPPSVQAFVFTAMYDKSQAAETKLSATPRSANVQVNINNYSDGTVDKKKIIDQILGETRAEIPV